MDPNKAYLPFDPFADEDTHLTMARRVRRVQSAVRQAMRTLNAPERTVIEGYYFDGYSFHRLADTARVSLARIRTIHNRALTKLRLELTPFVAVMYGLRLTQVKRCPVCDADWREDAERLLDEKTDEMTWGELVKRVERAVGWRAPTPQILITHQRKHRQFQPCKKGDS